MIIAAAIISGGRGRALSWIKRDAPFGKTGVGRPSSEFDPRQNLKKTGRV